MFGQPVAVGLAFLSRKLDDFTPLAHVENAKQIRRCARQVEAGFLSGGGWLPVSFETYGTKEILPRSRGRIRPPAPAWKFTLWPRHAVP